MKIFLLSEILASKIAFYELDYNRVNGSIVVTQTISI